MEVPDLQTYPSGHPPSPWPFPVVNRRRDPARYAVLPPELTLCAVGWLGPNVPTRGSTPPLCIDRLLKALDSDEVIAEGMRGYHACEVCEQLGTFFPGSDAFAREHFRSFRGEPLAPEQVLGICRSRPVIRWRETEHVVSAMGHHLVQHDRVVYMCPQLILHYVLDHEYRPPDEFIAAVVHGRFLTFDDLRILPEGGEREWFDRYRAKSRGGAAP